jgi:CcmD family protein
MIRRSTGRIALFLMLVFAGVSAAGTALAAQPRRPGPAIQPSVWEQPQPQQQPGQQNEFVPLKNLPALQQEHIPAAPLVMAAYAFVWVALLVYVWSVWRRVGAVQRELADLRRRTERKA